ncbi:hypothetical protein IFR04_006793 [Cadophora malorum]|uniref:Uncharacterized protein n=1 Tax=Cadophora malorum TaxID=108018 RepID=A0A8H7TED6_9HELO|nr:hypothetical protein IFR04_006793 [Cadophora malorum]
MATSGVKHFTDEYEMVKRHSYQMESTPKEQEELNLRMAVPYKNMKRTMFAKSALRKMNAVLKRDHRQIGEKVPGTSTKRPATDNMDSECPKKKQRTSESEFSKCDINIQITRIEQITNAFQELNSLSRRYNGPDGYFTPPPELKLYNQKMDSEKAERENTMFRQMRSERLPPQNLRDMYLQKLLIKSSHTIFNWTTPTVRPRPCLPQKERRPARYGAHQRNARRFVLGIVRRHMSANDASILNPLIVRASHGHLEALASNIESYIWTINMEVKHYRSDRTYTQSEIEDCRPQVRKFDELDIKQRLAEKRKWSAWRYAKPAADVAEDAMRLKIILRM